MKSGKFRKNNTNFSIAETIHEIMIIEQSKAEMLGVNIKINIQNFENRRQLIQCIPE